VAQGTPPGLCFRPWPTSGQSAGLSLSLRVVSSSGTTSRTTRGTTPWTSWIAWRCSNTAYAIWSGSRPRRNASQERHREGSPSPSPPLAHLLHSSDVSLAFLLFFVSCVRVECGAAACRQCRKNRDAFRALLKEAYDAGKLDRNSKWKRFKRTIKEDPRYEDLIGQSGYLTFPFFSPISAITRLSGFILSPARAPARSITAAPRHPSCTAILWRTCRRGTRRRSGSLTASRRYVLLFAGARCVVCVVCVLNSRRGRHAGG
jgi:hypothetical protein